MSRSGYSDDGEIPVALWRKAVDHAILGKRGQAFLYELAAALDAMPVKELIAEEIVSASGEVCAIGAVAVARKLDVTRLDDGDGEAVGQAFGVARTLACEIAYQNDEWGPRAETPAERWLRMRAWVECQLQAPPEAWAAPAK